MDDQQRHNEFPALEEGNPPEQMLADILDWDVAGWAPILGFWHQRLPSSAGARVLELGAHNGGISLYFALQGAVVVCSDRGGPTPYARLLHERYGAAERVTYQDLDATSIACADQEFDIVCFKSILGGIAGGGRLQNIPRVIGEVHRVLKPGGSLVFAENLAGSWLHMLARRMLVKWGRHWHYFKLPELASALEIFPEREFHCSGFLSAFGRTEQQRHTLHRIDCALEAIVPNSWRYIAAGYARKVSEAGKVEHA